MSEPRPSPAMRHALQNIAAGRDGWYGLHGAAAHGGYHGTFIAMRRRGYLTPDGAQLSDAGRAAIGLPPVPAPEDERHG